MSDDKSSDQRCGTCFELKFHCKCCGEDKPAAPSSNLRSTLEKILAKFKEADEERYRNQMEFRADSLKYKAEGDMYGYNFHAGMDAGANWVALYFVRVQRELEALIKATPDETSGQRTPKDYAIEHGGYLADAAESFIKAVDEHERVVLGFAGEDPDPGIEAPDMDKAEQAECDHRDALKNAIYEFRKRSDRAKHSREEPKERQCELGSDDAEFGMSEHCAPVKAKNPDTSPVSES